MKENVGGFFCRPDDPTSEKKGVLLPIKGERSQCLLVIVTLIETALNDNFSLIFLQQSSCQIK